MANSRIFMGWAFVQRTSKIWNSDILFRRFWASAATSSFGRSQATRWQESPCGAAPTLSRPPSLTHARTHLQQRQSRNSYRHNGKQPSLDKSLSLSPMSRSFCSTSPSMLNTRTHTGTLFGPRKPLVSLSLTLTHTRTHTHSQAKTSQAPYFSINHHSCEHVEKPTSLQTKKQTWSLSLGSMWTRITFRIVLYYGT